MKIRLKVNAIVRTLNPKRVYEVITVAKMASNDYIHFTVFDDEWGQPLAVRESDVEIVDPRIDADWLMRVEGNSFRLSHCKLSHPRFWEDFYGQDNDDAAEANAKALLKEVYPEYEEL